MAGWSLSSSSSPSSNVIAILRKLQSVGVCADITPTSPLKEENLTSIFDQILSIFLSEIYQKPEIRPLPFPALLGDGTPVNLFKLYWIVKEKGGREYVSSNKLWAKVAESIGYDCRVASGLKLVYVKYLDALDRWLEKVLVKNDDLGLDRVGEDGSKRDQFLLSPVRESGRRLHSEGDVVGGEEKVVTPIKRKREEGDEEEEVRNGSGTGKRKREDSKEELEGLLSWVLRVAKNSSDPSVGKLFSSEGVKDKAYYAAGKVYSQALLARQAMYLKKVRNGDAHEQKGQRIHPSTYEDHANAGTPASEKLRHSQRVHSVNRHLGFCSERHSATGKGQLAAGDESNPAKRKLRNSSSLSDVLAGFLPKDQTQRIPVGSAFQAKVPKWTGKDSATSYDSDDLKWLGTPIWPPEIPEKTPSLKQYPIGKGRQDSCKCEYPGSVECVRFHVAEKRYQLNQELGSAFHAWRCNRMGEEVALSWTEEEARKFKAIVRLNPPTLNKSFWDQLYLSFPSKGREDLVSYYFNVFLLGRRSYQNRMTPNNIDSDDEETEFGFLSSSFGDIAMKAHAPKSITPSSIICAQNAQCVDLDD